MSMVKKSITVTSQQDQWIKSRIKTGHYGNDSEVVRDLIRREQARTDALEAIRAALVEGEESGMSNLTPQEIFDEVKARLRADGKI